VQLNLKLKADTTSYDKKLKDNISSIMSIKNSFKADVVLPLQAENNYSEIISSQ